jgi:hypothetical protein
MANNFRTFQVKDVALSKAQVMAGTGFAADSIEKKVSFEKNVDLIAALNLNTDNVATASDIQSVQLAPKYEENNVTIGERLAISPAENAKQFAEAGLQELVQKLMALNPVGQPYKAVNLRDINISGFTKTVQEKTVDVTLTELFPVNNVSQFSKFQFNKSSFAIIDQASHFYQAVSAVDSHTIVLRQIEQRVAQYKQLLAEVIKLQAQLEDLQIQSEQRLAVIDGEITSARHHLAVAQLLKTEEMGRIAAVNSKRAAIIDRVDVVLFHKQRITDRFTSLPVAKASSVSVDGKLQIPLRNLGGVPPEISEMMQHFHAAPLSWFPALAQLPQFFDRPLMLIKAFEHVRMRATNSVFAIPQMPRVSTSFLGAAQKLIAIQATRTHDWRKAGLSLDANIIENEGLWAGYQRLHQIATLGDMVDGGHGSGRASMLAASQLDDLSKAFESLYASFADTPAEKRLAWAESFLENTGQNSFKALYTLPGWLSIDIDLRREQQGLVDLLYQQVYGGNDEAITAINRLILVALLLAAHAPVSQLISARMVRAVAALPGVIFDLTLDLTKVRIGMGVTIQNRPGEISARAVIDDIVGGQARARIVEVPTPNISLAIDAHVQLSEALNFKSSIALNKMVHVR